MNLVYANLARNWNVDIFEVMPTFKADIMQTAAETTRWESEYFAYMEMNGEEDPDGENFEYRYNEDAADQANASERDGQIIMARKVCRILGFPYKTKDDFDQLDFA